MRRTYVLLGDPGAGKSIGFRTGVGRQTPDADLVTARDFQTIYGTQLPLRRTDALH